MKFLKRPAKIKASFREETETGLRDYEKYRELQKLYPIVPATDTDRSWWKKMKTHYFAERPVSRDGATKQQKMNTIKYCPGVFDFSNCGYIVPCLHDMSFYVDKNQNVSWKLPERIPSEWIRHHVKEQVDSCPIIHDKDTGGVIIKVLTLWFWETPKGWSTIITKPFYNYSNDFDVCPGILDSDLDNMANHLIHVFLRLNVIEKEIVFRAGQPLCQLIPFERQNTKLTITTKQSKESKKMIRRDTAKMISTFPDNLQAGGESLMNYRDHSTKKYE